MSQLCMKPQGAQIQTFTVVAVGSLPGREGGRQSFAPWLSSLPFELQNKIALPSDRHAWRWAQRRKFCTERGRREERRRKVEGSPSTRRNAFIYRPLREDSSSFFLFLCTSKALCFSLLHFLIFLQVTPEATILLTDPCDTSLNLCSSLLLK